MTTISFMVLRGLVAKGEELGRSKGGRKRSHCSVCGWGDLLIGVGAYFFDAPLPDFSRRGCT